MLESMIRIGDRVSFSAAQDLWRWAVCLLMNHPFFRKVMHGFGAALRYCAVFVDGQLQLNYTLFEWFNDLHSLHDSGWAARHSRAEHSRGFLLVMLPLWGDLCFPNLVLGKEGISRCHALAYCEELSLWRLQLALHLQNGVTAGRKIVASFI